MIEEIADSIMEKFKGFTDEYRVMMLIDRGIQNSNKGSKRWINKLISSNEGEFKKNLLKLLDLQIHLNNPDIRLYSCVNQRNFFKSINYFQHKQLDLKTQDELDSFYLRINDQFCSALMQPNNKDERLFLLDLDTKDTAQLDSTLRSYQKDILLKYESIKGWHYIVLPFNPTFLENVNHCAIKKDALLLLHFLD